jgi:hypothetical protein
MKKGGRQTGQPAARPLLVGAFNPADEWALRSGPQVVDEVINQFTF